MTPAMTGLMAVDATRPTVLRANVPDPTESPGEASNAKVIHWRMFDPGHRFTLLAVVAEDGKRLMAYSPSLPGAATEGDTQAEAVENLKEAVKGCILAYRDAGEPIPWVEAPEVEEEEEVLFKGWIDVDV